MYIGSLSPSEHLEWILDDDKLSQKSLSYSNGLYTIVKEVIDNAIDEYIRTNGKYSNKISVKINNDKITVIDNGRGLPVEQDENGEWQPKLAFCQLRAGSNFSDDGRKTIGMNGVGSSATNGFSKKFDVDTCDGKNRFLLHCKDNISKVTYEVNQNRLNEVGTTVEFIPDYARFNVEHLPKEIELLVKTRLRMLSWFYPKCEFKYNNEKMSIKQKDFADMFPSNSISFNTNKLYVLIYPTDESKVLTYVDGISLINGGTHCDYIIGLITNALREKIEKKYKNIKPNDIKNKLGVVIFFNDFENCQFDSQTKDKLMNSEKEIKEYLSDTELDKFIHKISLNKEIISNITDFFRLKEELSEKKELDKLNKKVKNIDSEKYFPPIAKSGRKYLMITEGYSAFSGISKILGRKGIGYYSLRGKLLNVQDLSISKMMGNQEVSDLINILGIDLSDKNNTKLNYDNIIILTDQDLDGIAINSLCLAFFNKVCPNLFKEGRICRLNTPLMIGLNKNKVEEYYYNFPKSSEMKKSLTYKYLKGLGSWEKSHLDQVIEKEKGLENMLIAFKSDKDTDTLIDSWFNSDKSDVRKDYLRGKEFHIDLI